MPEVESEDGPKRLPSVTLEDFRSVDFQAAIASVEKADCSALRNAFEEAAKAAEITDDLRKALVFGLLASISSFHFRPDDSAEPFGPMWVVDGNRSAIPEDFKGAQCEVFHALLLGINHPGLRARLADVVWQNNRRAPGAAKVAIEAYCETANFLLQGKLKARFENLGILSKEELHLVRRALQIAGMVHKRGESQTTLSGQVADSIKEQRKMLNPLSLRKLLNSY
jgi:hypothetical protein